MERGLYKSVYPPVRNLFNAPIRAGWPRRNFAKMYSKSHGKTRMMGLPCWRKYDDDCCSYAVGWTTGRQKIRHPATSSRISSLHCIFSRHVHVIACPPPNIVYPCCSSSPRKTFAFYFTLNCSQNHAGTSSFPVAVLREFPMLNYGRPLSVSGRPCYILPMFFIYLFFFMAALFSGPG